MEGDGGTRAVMIEGGLMDKHLCMAPCPLRWEIRLHSQQGPSGAWKTQVHYGLHRHGCVVSTSSERSPGDRSLTRSGIGRKGWGQKDGNQA